MSIIISSGLSHEYQVGYSSFASFRIKLAENLDSKLGELYKSILTPPYLPDSNSNATEEFWVYAEDVLVRSGKISNATLDFLFACDCDGAISVVDAADILDDIKDTPTEPIALSNERIRELSIGNFKAMLEEGISLAHLGKKECADLRKVALHWF